VKKLLAAWLCLAIAACAASHKAAMAPTSAQPPTSAEHPQTTVETPHDEIERLSNDIAAQQSSALPAPQTPMSAGSSETCKSVCDIEGTICKNAKRICDLAEQLQPDDWATGKCNDATKACTDATQRCTDCG
jgi:hypothetical protein